MQFLKVKSALNPDELWFTNGRRLKMTSWKQPAFASYREVSMQTEPESKLTKKFYKIRRRFLKSEAVVSRSCFELMLWMNNHSKKIDREVINWKFLSKN